MRDIQVNRRLLTSELLSGELKRAKAALYVLILLTLRYKLLNYSENRWAMINWILTILTCQMKYSLIIANVIQKLSKNSSIIILTLSIKITWVTLRLLWRHNLLQHGVTD